MNSIATLPTTSVNQTSLVLDVISHRSDIKTNFKQDIYDEFEWYTADKAPTDDQPCVTWGNLVWTGVKAEGKH